MVEGLEFNGLIRDSVFKVGCLGFRGRALGFRL